MGEGKLTSIRACLTAGDRAKNLVLLGNSAPYRREAAAAKPSTGMFSEIARMNSYSYQFA